MRIRGRTISIAVAVVLLLGATYYFAGHKTAPGQPPLLKLDAASMTQLRTQFNAAVDERRMILLLSPT